MSDTEANEQSKRRPFSSLRDHFNLAGLAALAYGPHAAITGYLGGASDVVLNGAIYAGVFMALRVPYLREAPMFLSNTLILPLVFRQRKRAGEAIQSMVDEFAAKAGRRHRIKAVEYGKGMTMNAATVGDRIYVGKGLTDNLDESELRFVIAHEVAHSKTNDISEHYLFWPPFISSVFYAMAGIAGTVPAFASDRPVEKGGAALLFAGLAYGYYKAQSYLKNANARRLEYRADSNALKMTEDPENAMWALARVTMLSQSRFDRETGLFDSHPALVDRLENIRKTSAEIGIESASYGVEGRRISISVPN